MDDDHTPEQFNKSEEKKDYSPPTLHAVDMRKDRYGLKYPAPIGSARPDKEGNGQLMKMRANTVSGFHNVVTDRELKDIQAKYRKDRSEHENGRGRE